MKKIFIACPISKYLDGNSLNEGFERFIKNVYNTCKLYTNNVFMALYREKYGKNRMKDDICTPLDYEEMKDTDIVIAIPEDSQGVAIELGWASAMNKKIMLIMDKEGNYSPLINALDTIGNVDKYIECINNNYLAVEKKILSGISSYLKENIR